MRGLVAVLLVLTAACGAVRAPAKGGKDSLKGPLDTELLVPDYDKRNYLLHLPPGYDGSKPIPLVIMLHGGGGAASNAKKVTCKNGDENDASCLTQVADREGFAVVFPNGVPGDPFEDARSWNAGGGSDGFQCISGDACKNGSDDVKYLDAVHEELERALVLDDSRIFATGISDGGAMAERLACERSTRIAAIAPVAAGNQVAEVQGCSTALPVPVLEIHGSTDPCWNFAQGKGTCLQDDGGVKVGVNETIAGWVERNGCVGDVSNETIKDVDKSDGTTSSKEIHGGCVNDADVVLLKVQGGGHTWPGGFQYDGQGTIGAVARDFSASSEVWSFFKAHPRPPLE